MAKTDFKSVDEYIASQPEAVKEHPNTTDYLTRNPSTSASHQKALDAHPTDVPGLGRLSRSLSGGAVVDVYSGFEPLNNA